MHGLGLAFLALIVCGLEIGVFANVRFNPTLLIVPLAAWAGWRHRWRGFEIVALGAAPLLIGISSQVVRSPSNLGLYLVAVMVAALAATGRPLPALIPALRVSPGLMGAVVLLPLSMFLGERVLDSGVKLYGHLALSPLLFLGAFLLGFSRGRPGMLFALLALATIAGIALRLGLERGTLPFAYALDQPAGFLLAVALFHAARHLDRVRRGIPAAAAFTRDRWVLLALLALLYGGAPLYERLVQALGMNPSVARALSPVGSYYALPAFALVAGIVARFHGVAIACVAVTGLELLRIVAHYSSADAAAPLVAFGFAVLGTHLVDHARGRETLWYPGRWSAYLGVGALAAALLLPGEEPEELLVVALFIALLVLLALALRRLRRLIGPPGEQVVAAWIALAGAVLLVLGMLQQLGQSLVLLAAIPGLLAALFAMLGGHAQWRAVEAALPGIVAAFYLAVLLALLVELLRRLPALRADIAGLRHWYRCSRTAGHWRTVPAPDAPRDVAEPPQPGRAIATTVCVLRWARNALAIVAVAGLALSIAMLG